MIKMTRIACREPFIGNIGNYNGVVLKSSDIFLDNLTSSIWRTKIYTGNSNLLTGSSYSIESISYEQVENQI